MLSTAQRMYDAWATREPPCYDEPLPGDPGWPTCARGHWLTLRPASTRYESLDEQCDGGRGQVTQLGEVQYEMDCGEGVLHDPHTFTAHAWAMEVRHCKACDADVEIAVA